MPGIACTNCGYHNYFNPGNSSSYKDGQSEGGSGDIESFTLNYGSGAVKGHKATETITLDDYQFDNVKIGVVDYEDAAIAGFEMDAICGLAFDDLAVITRPPMYSYIGAHDMGDSRLLKEFAFFLNSDPDDTSMPSHVTFGWHNLSLAGKNAEWNYNPLITSDTFWTLNLKEFQVSKRSQDGANKEVLSMCKSEGCRLIVDTGTSGIGIPYRYYEKAIAVLTEGKSCVGVTCVGVREGLIQFLPLSISISSIFYFHLLFPSLLYIS